MPLETERIPPKYPRTQVSHSPLAREVEWGAPHFRGAAASLANCYRSRLARSPRQPGVSAA